MIHYQRSLLIQASPDTVWAELARFMHIDEFAPQVTSVEPLNEGEIGVGSRRRCHFENGSSMVEEIVEWEAVRRYRVRLFETEPMPLKEAYAEIALASHGDDQTNVTWSMDYQVKWGPIGWLMGQTLMKMMMGKVLDGNLKGLAEKVAASGKQHLMVADQISSG